mgnify:CR=1 FL=1
MTYIAPTPKPPYYAVIFTSIRTGKDDGYAETVAKLLDLARHQPGFLGYEGARNPDGMGISVSYWKSLDAICVWRNHHEHRQVQTKADHWYGDNRIRICMVEKDY